MSNKKENILDRIEAAEELRRFYENIYNRLKKSPRKERKTEKLPEIRKKVRKSRNFSLTNASTNNGSKSDRLGFNYSMEESNKLKKLKDMNFNPVLEHLDPICTHRVLRRSFNKAGELDITL